MRYRISLHPGRSPSSGRCTPCPPTSRAGWGTPIPNPIQLRDKLWLFWRGGGWNPTFSYTEDGLHWVPARELVHFGGGQRPYAKYVGDGRPANPRHLQQRPPEHWKNGLHYLRYEARDLFAVGGRRLGTPRRRAAAHVQARPHLPLLRAGRAAPGRTTSRSPPKAGRGSSTRAAGGQDTFYYALPQRRAVDQPQDRRGRRRPRALLLRRRDARPRGPALRLPLTNDRPWSQVEQWFTPDEGRTWTPRQLTARPDGFCSARSRLAACATANRIVFVSRVTERTKGYRDYRSRVHVLQGAAPPV